jgi:2-hydroxychromene-2-carboxylate isomerase
MSVIIYADFSRPDCYLASRRADALRAAGLDVDWRAVEHQPGLPVTGRGLCPADEDALVERFATLGELLLPGEQLPWTAPRHAPKTEAAISAYAAAYGTGEGDDVRRLLFELYWLHGADIGSPTVLRTPLAGPIMRAGVDAEPLRQCGFAVNVDRGPITTDAYHRIRGWRSEWHELGSPVLPVLLVDGATLSGLDALRRLDKEITYIGADVNPELADPRRYPLVQVHPSPAWVSQIGGRWRNIYRLNPTQ